MPLPMLPYTLAHATVALKVQAKTTNSREELQKRSLYSVKTTL